MQLTAYQQAMADLATDAARTIELAFTAWSPDVKLGRVSQNVACETTLATARFTSLLDSFGAQLASGEMPVDAWRTACRTHKLQGRQIPATDCPTVLGRARSLDDHAVSIARASGGILTSSEAKKLLLKYSESLAPAGLNAFLRDAPLGNYRLGNF